MGNNNQKYQNSNNQQQEHEKLRIDIKDPASFVDEAEVFTRHMTSREFCERVVNPLFKGTFKDFDGSYCTLMNTTQGPKMFIDLHFSKSNQTSNAPYEALIEKTQKIKNSGDTFSRVQALSSKMNSSRIYDLTDEAKELLSDFNPGEKDPKKIKWKDKMTETSGTNTRGIMSANVKIVTFDPIVIVRKFYGRYIQLNGQKTDRAAEYNIEVVKQIQNMYTPNSGVELLLKLTCYDRNNAERSIIASGGMPQLTSNPMYPA